MSRCSLPLLVSSSPFSLVPAFCRSSILLSVPCSELNLQIASLDCIFDVVRIEEDRTGDIEVVSNYVFEAKMYWVIA